MSDNPAPFSVYHNTYVAGKKPGEKLHETYDQFWVGEVAPLIARPVEIIDGMLAAVKRLQTDNVVLPWILGGEAREVQDEETYALISREFVQAKAEEQAFFDSLRV